MKEEKKENKMNKFWLNALGPRIDCLSGHVMCNCSKHALGLKINLLIKKKNLQVKKVFLY